MSNQFTQGPWIYDDSQRYYSTRVVRMNGVVVCNPVHQSTMQQTEYDANVRLIAAAPALYAALANAIRELKWAADNSKNYEEPVSLAVIQGCEAALALVDSKNGEL